jgi:hypothetical protein
MARYDKAKWRPLAADPSHQALMDAHDGIILHTMVGTLAGTDSLFHQDGYTGTESHFGVGPDGTIYQWTDTARTADANLEGTHRLLSIETADMGDPFPTWSGSNVPAWTEKQLDAIAAIVAWAATTHDFPLAPMENSKPGQRGVGWHRLGVDSSPPFQPGYRVSGGEHWSTSVGKACPGDRRIHQVPEVIARAKAIQSGDNDMQLDDDLTPVDDTQDETVGVSLKTVLKLPAQIAAVKDDVAAINTELDNRFKAVNANVNGFQEATKNRLQGLEETLNTLVEALVPKA